MGIEALETEIAFCLGNKKYRCLMNLVQTGKIEIATIHQIDSPGLEDQVVQDLDVVNLFTHNTIFPLTFLLRCGLLLQRLFYFEIDRRLGDLDYSLMLQSVINGILLGSIYGLIAMGLAIIFGVVRIINLAHGDFLMVSMYIAYYLFTLFHIDPYISLVVSIPFLFVMGMIIQKVFIGPVQKKKGPPENLLLITYGVGLIIVNTAMLAFSPTYRSVLTAYATKTIGIAGFSASIISIFAFVMTSVAVALLFLFLKRTDTGKQIRATSENPEAALLLGINVDRISCLVFGIGAACVGLAGGLFVPMFYVYPTIGMHFTIKSFIVVVLGGLGSVIGAILGGIILGVVESLGALYVSTAYKDVLGFILFLLILLFRPSGLFGEKTRL